MSYLLDETRLLLRAPSARVVLMLWILALLYALLNGSGFSQARRVRAEQYQSTLEAQLAARQEDRLKQERGEPVSDPNATAPSGLRGVAVLTPGPLSFLAVGQQDLQPFTASIGLLARPDALLKNRSELQSPMALAAGRFDASFAVVFLMPLVLIALAYGQFAEERDQGRLSLLAVQRGSLGRLLALRMALRFAAVALPLALLTGVATLLLAGPSQLLGWMLWLMLALAWLTLWTALVVAIAGVARSAGSAALSLASAWLLLVLVLPVTLNAALQWLAPPPSKLALIEQVRAAELDAATKAKALLGSYLHDHPELDQNAPGGPSAWARSYYVQQQEVNGFVAQAHAAQQVRIDEQRRTAELLMFLAPAAALHDALIESTGSGNMRYRAFVAQLQTFKKTWDESLRANLFAGQPLSSAEISQLARFRFAEPDEPVPLAVIAYLMLLATLVLAMRLPALRRLSPASSSSSSR